MIRICNFTSMVTVYYLIYRADDRGTVRSESGKVSP